MKVKTTPLRGATGGKEVQSDTPLLLAAAEELRSELAGLLRRAAGAKHLGVEFVHDLRVATRRMEEAARLLAELMDAPAAEGVRASLKAVRRPAGEVRDVDVTRKHLAAGSGKWHLPAALRSVTKALLKEMSERRSAMEKRLGSAVAAASVMGAMVMLARVIEEKSAKNTATDAQRRLAAVLAKQRERRAKSVRKAFGKAAKKQTPESLHAARIAAKKLRYVLELADAGGEKAVKKRIHLLKDMQDVLGDHHDAVVLLELVGERAESAGGKAAARAYKKWRRTMGEEQARRAAAFFAMSYAWMNL